ncbi:HAMP domain-containing histidine kinase [Chryseobacterium sp. LC2016-27]|uniref:sensor histidine kinase n=1 Tax=Chryseobacterium sp. LC2016-27 TaxID=2897326 RepID=UPI001E2F81F8|nr:HAMP domain-containing sensor histidine kinase [Chryseobacterium sp. LC2016-27]MCD0453877.1 HAMP domain-containing histidine kinase [Chryseobacterium sp. LC2016-27]
MYIFASMISKSKYLISLFAALFLLLLGIQVYFMYKTSQVKKREIYSDVHNRIDDYIDNLEDLGGASNLGDEGQRKIFAEFNNKKISKKEFLEYFEKNKKQTQDQLSDHIDHKFEKEGYKVAVRTQFLSIVYVPKNINLIDQPVTLYETRNKITKAGISNTGKWETSSTSKSDKSDQLERDDSFFVRSQTDFQILNINTVVFQDLTLLILCCVAILLSVLVLYIFTVKNLIRQQKQVEVLHTVVDNISHEFKTPIATLKIASKTLKKEFTPEILPLIDRQILRLEDLMLQLHPEDLNEKNSTIEPENWDLFIHDLAFTYKNTDFKLNNSVSKELPFDKKLMETVIKNLCENSVKYGASEIKIDIKNIQNKLEIIVADNGNGMEQNELKNIFEKFYRIQSNNIHNSKGLGLGLFFVKKIVEKYSGKTEIMSEVNIGTTFKISIPYED